MVKGKQVNNDYLQNFLDFVQKNWIVITGLLLVVPYLDRYLKAQALITKEKNADIAKDYKLLVNQNPITQNEKRLAITGSKDLHAASTKLASDFGFLIADRGNWYDFMLPKGWTENDEEIRKTLVLYRNYFNILEKLYFEVDTNSRSLRKDILELLDKDELTYLRKYLKI